ncbi:YecA family protein [Sporosarcina sp. CAU 1771]
MIGRNDPCLCGSGKKYKRCCSGKNEKSVDTIIDEELERILLGVYDQATDRNSVAEFDGYLKSWKSRLTGFIEEGDIDVAVSEYFLFIAREDIWKQHLLRVLNTKIRSATRAVAELWQTPIVVFGMVKEVQNGFIEVEEILGEGTYFLEKREGVQIEKGTVVFGLVLSNTRIHPQGVVPVTSLLIIRKGSEAVISKVVALAENSGLNESRLFYKEHMLDVYSLIMEVDNKPVEEVIEQELSEVQNTVLDLLVSKLEETSATSEEQKAVKSIGLMYLQKEQPNFRKPDVVSAGLFQSGIYLGILKLDMTQTEVAKLFEVSVGAMTKHAEKITDYTFEEHVKQAMNK